MPSRAAPARRLRQKASVGAKAMLQAEGEPSSDEFEGSPKGHETNAEYLKRLRAVATSLPKGYVESVIGRVRENIQALIDAKGYTPRND